MATLEEMARKKFPFLSEAEQRVLKAASDGSVADCRDLGGDEDLQNVDGTPRPLGEQWPETRNVRADLIRWLCIDREARELVDPKGVWIQGARITGELDLSYTNISFPLFLLSCRLEERLDLRWAKMPVLNLGGSWTGAIAADGLKVEGSLFLRNGFHAEGEVRLLGATIGGNLEADGGTFKNLKSDKNPDSSGDALSADGIKVTGDVYLRNGFIAEGEVRLTGAQITGQLEIDDAWLDEVNLQSAHITGSFFWQNIKRDHQDHKERHPDFPNKEWKPSLDLTNARVGSLLDEEASWPEKGGLRLDGFVYDRIGEGPTDAKRRLKWLGLQPKPKGRGYLPQPYEQLIAVLRRMGHEHQVAKVAIAKQKDLRKHGDLGWLGWIRSWFLYLVVGYGYEPWRAFLGMAMLVLLGTLVFSVARLPSVRVMVPSDKEAYESDQTVKTPLPYYYPQFHASVYSLDVISPFDLGQKSHWRLHERWPCDFVYWLFEFYSLIQLFAGWVLLAVAAAALAGLIKKD